MSETLNDAVIKELIKELIEKYIENAYPWGLITRPLTPIAMSILAIMYVLTISMLILGTFQIMILAFYGTKTIKYLKNTRAKNNNHVLPHGSLPKVSILIPIKNESMETIVMQLKNLSRLVYPRESLEVLFISDDTKEYADTLSRVINNHAINEKLNARLIHRPNHVGYKGGALNYGLKYASGDVILIMDVDTMLPRDYLIKTVGMLLNGYDAATATWKGYRSVDTVFSRMTDFMYDVFNELFIRGRILAGGFPAISGNNIVIWRKVLDSIGGFCECTGEDLDLSIKLRHLGYKVGIIDDDVYCDVPHDYQSFKSQLGRWVFNGIWNLKHNIKLVLNSKYMSKWEKVDAILWMLQFPSTSFAALSVIISIITNAMGVLIPPLSLTILEIMFIISVIDLAFIVIIVGDYVGYGMKDTIKYSINAVLVALLLSFPMLINTIESFISDEYQWVVTPKGPVSKLNMDFKYLLPELVAVLSMFIITIISVIYGQLILFIYTVTLLALMIYGIRLIILDHKSIKYHQ